MARMKILSAAEQTVFDTPPLFNHLERKQFFEFPKSLLKMADSFRHPINQVCFLVSCGYFKATKRFFSPATYHPRDIAYVSNQLAIDAIAVKDYLDRTRQRHQKLILDFYGYSSFNVQAENMLKIEIATMAKSYLKPKLIFERCLDFLMQNRTQVPKSGTLILLIRAGLLEHKAVLIALMETHLDNPTCDLLANLFTTSNDQSRYRLTLLKKLSQSTKPSRVKESIADFEILSELYYKLDDTLSKLNLGYEGIRYYAGSVLRSRMFQLQRREANDRYIHTTAFIAHQFFRIQDNLADTFLSVMATFQNTVTRHHKDHLFEQRKAQNQQLKAVVDELDGSVFALIRDMRSLVSNNILSDVEKVTQMKTLLEQGKTESFEELKAGLQQAGQSEIWHDILEQQSVKLQNRLSPILKALTFEPIGQTEQLMGVFAQRHESD